MDLNPAELLIRVPMVLLALTVHEFCHAYFAYRMGDPTAARQGRLTLNPIKHLDPLGTICLMFAPIGWAKPVPVDPLNFRDRRMGDLVTSIAGPGSNLVLAVLFAVIVRGLVYAVHNTSVDEHPQLARFAELAVEMFWIGIFINVGLAVFNCLPIYPLDGYHVTLQLIPARSQQGFADTAMYGPFMLLGVIVLSRASDQDILGRLIDPVIRLLVVYVAGVPLSPAGA